MKTLKQCRILIVHCRYMQRGGEEAVFDSESTLLENAGYDVVRYEVSNEQLKSGTLFEKLESGLSSVWSRAAFNSIDKVLQEKKPDIVHFHNTFPALSPSVFYAASARNIPAVQTLHNYRLGCANAMLLRNGTVCERCVGGAFYNSVKYACYRNSVPASAAVAAMQYFHRTIGTFQTRISRYIALTEFARRKFIQFGIADDRIVVKPNSLGADPGVGKGLGNYALYVGRLSAEKGVTTLVSAWREISSLPLLVAGDGPLAAELSVMASSIGGGVKILGNLPKSEIMALMGDAKFLIVPSEWYEGFPMTVVEAYARGLPVVASRIGSLEEVVEDGVTGRHFAAGNRHSLIEVVQSLLHDHASLNALRSGARDRFLNLYSPERNLAELERIYLSAIR